MAEKIKVGDVRPIFQQVGWEVCKKAAEKEEDCEFIAVEKAAEAETLSLLIQLKAKKE